MPQFGMHKIKPVNPIRISRQAISKAKRNSEASPLPQSHWLLYCRPGFELDCSQEVLRQARRQRPILIKQSDITSNSGYIEVLLNNQVPSYHELIFTRQLIRLHQSLSNLSDRDRLTPILASINAMSGNFSALWLEVPDTNKGKLLSGFTRRFQPLLEKSLLDQGRLRDEVWLPRLHLFFPDKSSVLIGISEPDNSSRFLMGISRQSMPHEAPSRSTLKLAEAIEVLMDRGEQTRLLRQGMRAVDLGAAPGGWTWQLVSRGIHVTAVDNGPMKGALVKHPLATHLKQDGFKYVPRRAVDWLVCDMIERPSRVATLIGDWFVAGRARHAIFNLKLPMKQRLVAVDCALGDIRKRLNEEGLHFRMKAKHLYHDREEITVYLTKAKK